MTNVARNLLDDLAKLEVPPPPTDFNRQVHRRLNGWLLLQQLADLAVKGMAYALLHFLRTIAAGLTFTFTGQDLKPSRPSAPSSDNPNDAP